MRVNLDGTRVLLEAMRATGRRPRLVFTSTLAVYGGDMPQVIQDGTHLTPQTSYGTQKAIGELLVADYSRKGFIDGRALRLPTIVVRPGKPNKAASTFASSIIREPLAGQEAVCPVGREAGMFILSPRRVVDALLHAMRLPDADWGTTRALQLPGITATVGEMADSLARIAGQKVAGRIRWEPDPTIQRIVAGWPARAAGERAQRMGFSRRQLRRDRPGPHRGRAGWQDRKLRSPCARATRHGRGRTMAEQADADDGRGVPRLGRWYRQAVHAGRRRHCRYGAPQQLS